MFAAAARIRTQDPDPEVFRARAALSDGNLTEAEEAPREADRRRPGWWKTAWQLSNLGAAQGNHEEAARLLARFLEQFPLDRIVLTELGAVSLKLGHHEAEGAAFARALGVDPEDVDAHSGLAVSLRHLGREPESKHHAELASRFRNAA